MQAVRDYQTVDNLRCEDMVFLKENCVFWVFYISLLFVFGFTNSSQKSNQWYHHFLIDLKQQQGSGASNSLQDMEINELHYCMVSHNLCLISFNI